MTWRAWVLALSFVAVLVAGLTGSANALDIDIVYDDQPGEGFLDPMLGAARRAAFEVAIGQWADTLAGSVPIIIAANMPRLGGTGASALLASAGAVTLHRRFSNSRPDTWYAAALANQLSGTDLNGPTLAEVAISFNADVDGPEVLGSIDWYYGLDAQPGADIDFVTIALHEVGHGLGFLDTIDASSGSFPLGSQPAILERMLWRPEIGGLSDLLPTERLAAIVATGDLFWDGPAVAAFNGAPLAVFSPDPFQQGSSIAHWDTELPAAELMQPFYVGANHDLGALLPALIDMGWQVAVPTPTPRAPQATPTPTKRPRPSPTASAPVAVRDMVYVANFDDSTVSVIDAAARAVVQTVPVDDGPIGIAASADGTRVYVACFQAGTLSVLRTGDDHVIASVPAGESPNGIAVTADGAFIAVTDTAADRLVIVAADTLEVLSSVTAGEQPSAIALDGGGRLAFTSNFSGATVTVVDLDARKRRAIIPVPFATASTGLLGIAVAPATGRGYIAAFYESSARLLRTDLLRVFQPTIFPFPFPNVARPEAVVTDATGTFAYFAGHDAETGTGRLSVVRMEDNEVLATILVGLTPEALALAPDEALLYVANTGNNNVSVIDTDLRRSVGVIRVGKAPMGIVAVAVPEGQCTAECETPTATPTVPAALCPGDCDGDGTVSVDELIVVTGIALERGPLPACPAADSNRDGTVTVAEIVGSVQRSLTSCDG